MPEIEIPNLSLRHLVLELRPLLEGSFINKIQELENNWLKIRLQTREGGRNLIATNSAIFVSSYKLKARQQSSGYGAFLRKHLFNKRVKNFGQHAFERIVFLEFDDFFLFFELFAKGNALLTDKNKKILKPLKARDWAARSLRKGQRYEFPPARGLNPEELKLGELQGIFSSSSKDAVRTLVSEVNAAPVFCEEALFKAQVDKNSKAGNLSKEQAKKIFSELKKLHSSKPSEESKPVLIEEKSKKVLLPFSLSSKKDLEEKIFPSLNEALDELFAKKFLEEKEKSPADKELPALRRTLERQKLALKKAKAKEEEMKQKAQAIYSNYPVIQEALQAFKEAEDKKLGKEEIMYKPSFLSKKVKKIDLKENKLVIELD